MPEPMIEIVDPGPVVSDATAPKSIAAPEGRQASANVQATWEALILAHLDKYCRYPARARAVGQQGVAHIRFTMNREGRFLLAELARKIGRVHVRTPVANAQPVCRLLLEKKHASTLPLFIT